MFLYQRCQFYRESISIMDQVRLYNGFCIPKVGYGTFPNKEKLEDSIQQAYKNGYRLIDTSDNYGNEDFVGHGLKKCPNDIVVITKFSLPLQANVVKCCFKKSEYKIGRRINIYLLHWPYPYLWKTIWRQMEKLYISGECDAIGVCNFDLGYLKELLSFCKIKPAINQFERHPLFQQDELVKYCQENDIAVMSYSPVARMDKSLHTNNLLNSLSEKYNKTVSQIILRWNIDTESIPIPASVSSNHIKENIDLFNFSLSEEDVNKINKLEIGKRIRFNPRTRFTRKEKLIFFVFSILCRFVKK